MAVRTLEDRNKLIIDNMYLVKSIAEIYSKKTRLDINDLLSYGYEGLIVGVDNYDESLGAPKPYLQKYIVGYILTGMTHIQRDCSKNVYFNYLEAKNEVEQSVSTTLEEDVNLVDQILNLLLERKQISFRQAKNIKINVIVNQTEPLQQHKQDLFIEEDSLFDEATADIRKNILNEFLNVLSYTERIVINELFGLEDQECKTLTEVAKNYSFSIEGIRKIKKRALKKLMEKQYYLYPNLELFGYEHKNVKLKTK